MMHGLWKLTWVEIKIFLREPLGVIGAIGVPVFVFVLLARLMRGAPPRGETFVAAIPALGALLIAISAVLSLVTIISIYRESGILKRLRATPLRPHTILVAHVIVKLLLTVVTLVLMIAAGSRWYRMPAGVPLAGFTVALVVSTISILSLGFVIASIIRTARFAQPVATAILYPMLGLSGLFLPLSMMPPPARAVARLLPLTYAASLMKGIWQGDGWGAHSADVAVLTFVFIVCTSVSARVFRWE